MHIIINKTNVKFYKYPIIMNDVTMHETFEEVSNKQLFFKKILVEVGYPFSKVFLKKKISF